MKWLYKCDYILTELRDSVLEKRQRKKEYKNALLVNQIAIMAALRLLLAAELPRDSISGKKVYDNLERLIRLGNEILHKLNKEEI